MSSLFFFARSIGLNKERWERWTRCFGRSSSRERAFMSTPDLKLSARDFYYCFCLVISARILLSFCDFFGFENICQTWKTNGQLLPNFQCARRLNQAMKYKTTKAKKLLNSILSSYLRTLSPRRHRSVRILFLMYIPEILIFFLEHLTHHYPLH